MSETMSAPEACKLLPPGKTVHTLKEGVPGLLLGADCSRLEVVKAMKAADTIHITGPTAQEINHGLAIADGRSMMFIETKPKEWEEAQWHR